MNLESMSRKEKFRYLKANDVKCMASMKTAELDALLVELDKYQRGETDSAPEGATKTQVRTARKRVPLGSHRAKLSADHLNIPKHKVARWVNDKPGRIAQALEGGYELVRNPERQTAGESTLTCDNLGDSVVANVGVREDGQPQKAYLMVIDRDLFQEDQAFKQRTNDALDEAVRTGTVEPGEGQYIPSSGIKYDN